ncbi:hypothetical protein QFC24_000760 [Naganishia onofrii]|uniref:Uncharacterized protein n=1 Tax=Naganishia onofrii TaxID=1851511 RepID=A0ACC2XUP5_9TREE|nr:hypothetical protein QFC24_000760 [Naganishia onofrii]
MAYNGPLRRGALRLAASTSPFPAAAAADPQFHAIHSYFHTRALLSLRHGPPAQQRTRTSFHQARGFSSDVGTDKSPSGPPSDGTPPNTVTPPPPLPHAKHPGHAQDYIPLIRRLLPHLPTPHNPLHRPTKEELLAAATSVWQRLRIRFKWFSIRGWRRFNADDLSAFLSWFLVGNTLWVVLGTTTFVSAVFATLNSLSLQNYVAKLLSNYLTQNTGFTVVFESAIVPKWGASTITFKNVYVSRRPQEDDEDEEEEKEGRKKLATSAILSAIQNKIKPAEPSQTVETNTTNSPERESEAEKEDRLKRANNYTMFDLNFEEIDVTFSLPRWLDGKGVVQNAIIKGVRGVIDRRHVWWDTSVPLKPEDFRHETRLGDFELDTLDVEDFLVTVYQPGGQRPFNVSIFNASIGPFRKRWMFFDLMSADAIVGQYDNCLFSLHKPQKLGKSRSQEEKDDRIKRLARFRIDGLPIEHAQYATGFQGPMSWLTAGKVDAVLDIKFPRHPDEEVDINAILNQIGRNVAEIAKATGVGESEMEREDTHVAGGATTTTTAALEAAQQAIESIKKDEAEVIPGQHRLARPALRPPDQPPRLQPPPQQQQQQRPGLSSELQGDDVKMRERQVKIDIDLRFRDIKAAVPMYTTDLSVSNNAFIRPIVAFMNRSHKFDLAASKPLPPPFNFSPVKSSPIIPLISFPFPSAVDDIRPSTPCILLLGKPTTYANRRRLGRTKRR